MTLMHRFGSVTFYMFDPIFILDTGPMQFQSGIFMNIASEIRYLKFGRQIVKKNAKEQGNTFLN